MHVANERADAVKEGFAIGVVSIRYTFWFYLLMFSQILLSIWGFGTTVWQLVKNREILKKLFGVIKKRINTNNKEKIRKRDKLT